MGTDIELIEIYEERTPLAEIHVCLTENPGVYTNKQMNI